MKTIKVKRPQISMILKSWIDPFIQKALTQHNGFVSGGAITSVFTRKPINDIDIYFISAEGRQKFIKALNPGYQYKNNTDFSKSGDMKKDAMKKAQVVFETENAISFWFRDKKYQVIKAFDGNPSEVFDKYDFTINMCAWLPETDEFELHEDFFEHLAQRRLVIHLGTEYPISTVVRMFKYQKKGYIISGVEVIKIILGCHSLKMVTLKDLKRQLQGIDTLFLKPLTDYIDKKDNGDIPYDYEKIINLLEYLFQHFQDQDLDRLFDQHGSLMKNENIGIIEPEDGSQD